MNPLAPVFGFSASGSLFGVGRVICLLAACVSTMHGQLLTKASEDFQWQYNPIVLPNQVTPTASSWILRTGGVGNSASVDGTALHITSPAGSYLYYEARVENWRDAFESSIGFTLEIKVRVEASHTFGVNLGFDEGSLLGAGRASILKIDGSGTFWQTGSGGNVGFEEINGGRNDDAYHVFRLVKLPGTESVAGGYNIYRDGILLAENVAGANASLQGLNRFFFGAIGNTLVQDVQADVQWVRWDATGAYAPVPEPVTLSFVGMGGLVLIARNLALKNRSQRKVKSRCRA